jgi:hypothetical protein
MNKKRMAQLLSFVMLLSASAGVAQQAPTGEITPSRIDLFAGYSYWVPNGSVANAPFPNDNKGAVLSGAYFLNRTLGFELSGDYHPENSNDSMLAFGIGPIVRRPLWQGKITLFAHGLIGAADISGPFAPVIGPQYYYHQLGADWGPRVTLGGGLDVRLPYFHHRLGVRLFQADYVYEHVNFGPTSGIAGFNSGLFSTGLLWHLGSIEPPPPVTLACTATPRSVFAGDPVSVIGVATNLDHEKKADFRWIGPGVGTLAARPIVDIDSSDLKPGAYTVNGHVSEGSKPGQSANCNARFTVMAFDPPSLSCSANPAIVKPGETVMITALAASPQNRPLQYSYSASAGTIAGTGAQVTLNTAGAAAGPITISCGVSDDKAHAVSSATSVSVQAPPPPPVPRTQTLCSFGFGKDARVNNEGKACLDEVALSAQHQVESTLVLVAGEVVPEFSGGEKVDLAAERSIHAKSYLVREKGIDPARIQVRTRKGAKGALDSYLVPAGANFDGDVPGTSVVDDSFVRPAR